MSKLISIYIFTFVMIACSSSQDRAEYRLIGGPCEGCEAILDYGNRELNPVDTLPDFEKDGTKIKITGTVYQGDAITPASDVILYVYHTNQDGRYPPGDAKSGWAKKHGYIRSWLKTGTNGQYAFYTLLPGAYPTGSEPAHIHLTILEPDGKYYWLASYKFKGDSLLSEEEIQAGAYRGGSNNILTLTKNNNILEGRRDIILGKNIPGY